MNGNANDPLVELWASKAQWMVEDFETLSNGSSLKPSSLANAREIAAHVVSQERDIAALLVLLARERAKNEGSRTPPDGVETAALQDHVVALRSREADALTLVDAERRNSRLSEALLSDASLFDRGVAEALSVRSLFLRTMTLGDADRRKVYHAIDVDPDGEDRMSAKDYVLKTVRTMHLEGRVEAMARAIDTLASEG